MSERTPGYYWLNREGRAPGVGRYEDGRWDIVGEAMNLTETDLENLRIEVGSAIGATSRD